jgi:hypothetical protein
MLLAKRKPRPAPEQFIQAKLWAEFFFPSGLRPFQGVPSSGHEQSRSFRLKAELCMVSQGKPQSYETETWPACELPAHRGRETNN